MEYFTSEGLKKIKEKLRYLKKEKRKEIAERLAKAQELGDLSENAEYTTTKEEQGLMEAEILRLENLLKAARVITDNNKKKDVVQMGNCVLVKIDDEKYQYTLVGSEEIDLAQGKISAKSPIGRTLLGKKIGERSIFKMPAGEEKQFEIIDIL